MSITMHGTSIFSDPVYISLYFPPSSNRDISMQFLALSYSYSEQCWSYINNACPFWHDAMSLQLLPLVITPPLPKNREAQLVPRSIRRRQKTDDHSDTWARKVILQKPHCVQAPWNTWVSRQWLLCLWAGYQLVGAFRFLSWRLVNSLGSHSLFLRLNYPIN